MFRKLRLLYYNNKEKIWVAIGIIVFVVVIIQIINYNIKKNREEELANTNVSKTEDETYLPSKKSSVISDTSVSEKRLEEDTTIIDEFVEHCNSNNIEEAYNLLSQDCKDEMFQNIDRFNDIYIKDIFTEKRDYDLETWNATPSRVTYRIKYQNDIMGTGTINEGFIEDYITVIEENDEKKLNIKETSKETKNIILDLIKIIILNRKINDNKNNNFQNRGIQNRYPMGFNPYVDF